MKKTIRTVIDTDVFINAMFSNDEACKEVFYLERDKKIVVFMNDEMYYELIDVIMSRLRSGNLTAEQIIQICNILFFRIWEIKRIPRSDYRKICIEDENDDKLFDCAIDGKVDYIISCNTRHVFGYEELLEKKYRVTLKIMEPESFLSEYETRNLSPFQQVLKG